MAIVKMKPTSAGRRGMVRVVAEGLHKGAPYAPLLEKRSLPLVVITTAILLYAIRVVVISSIIVW